MQTYTKYWAATLVRGIVAVFAGMGVFVLPQAINLVFLLPFAILISMMCLAAYGTVDSVVVLVTSFLIPHHEAGRLALRVQGILGAVCGIALFFLVVDRAQLPWFLYLAAFQALGAAITELTVARGTSAHHGSRWCYASAVVASIAAVALVSGRNLDPQNVAWLLFGYLGTFGITLCLLSARMLFAERCIQQDVTLREAVLAVAL